MDSLSRIGIFVEVAKQESFAGAARALGITSSAVSKQVQNLEHELKTKLLNRTTRKVSLTEEGALFLDRAGRALDDIAEAKEQINELKATPRGTLRVNVPMAFGNSHLKRPIAEFAALYPEVTLDVSFDDRLVDIVEEAYDVVIRVGALQDSSMIARKLSDAPIHVYASRTYLERHGTPITAADLAHHNVLAYTRNRGAHEWRYKGPDGREGVVPLQSSFKADAAEMMIEAACHGIGIMISPAFFVAEAEAEGRVVRILSDHTASPERGVYALFPPNRYMSTRLRLFVDYLGAYCGKF